MFADWLARATITLGGTLPKEKEGDKRLGVEEEDKRLSVSSLVCVCSINASFCIVLIAHRESTMETFFQFLPN